MQQLAAKASSPPRARVGGLVKQEPGVGETRCSESLRVSFKIFSGTVHFVRAPPHTHTLSLFLTHSRTCTYAHIHIYTHTHTHTHTHPTLLKALHRSDATAIHCAPGNTHNGNRELSLMNDRQEEKSEVCACTCPETDQIRAGTNGRKCKVNDVLCVCSYALACVCCMHVCVCLCACACIRIYQTFSKQA